MIVSEWLEKWLTLHASKVRPSTIRGYRAALAHLGSGFLALDLLQVTGMDWEAEIFRIRQTYPRQAELAHVALRKAWKDGQRHHLIPWDMQPWQYVEAPRHDKRETPFLLPEEMPAYYRAAMQTEAALPLFLMLCLGLRRGEALGLAWEDIDARSQVIHIRRQLINGISSPLKTNSSYRKIPVSASVIDKIYNLGCNDGFLCYNGTVKSLYRSHQAALEAAGIDAGVTLHGLRHTMATAAMAAGADIKSVQGILGHASYTITADTYVHSLLEPEREVITTLCTRLEIA